jgi:hypothetical protein
MRPRGYSIDGAGIPSVHGTSALGAHLSFGPSGLAPRPLGYGAPLSPAAAAPGGPPLPPQKQRRISAPSFAASALDAEVEPHGGRFDQGLTGGGGGSTALLQAQELLQQAAGWQQFGAPFGAGPSALYEDARPQGLLAAMQSLGIGAAGSGCESAATDWQAAAATAAAMQALQAQAAGGSTLADAMTAYAHAHAMQGAALGQGSVFQHAYQGALLHHHQQQQQQAGALAAQQQLQLQLLAAQAAQAAAAAAVAQHEHHAGAWQALQAVAGVGQQQQQQQQQQQYQALLSTAAAGARPSRGSLSAPLPGVGGPGGRRAGRQSDVGAGVRDAHGRRSFDRGLVAGGPAERQSGSCVSAPLQLWDEAPDYRRVFIGNLAWWVDEDMLSQSFEQFGTVIDVQVRSRLLFLFWGRG